MAKQYDPYIKEVYRRRYKIHISTLMEVVKDKRQLDLYCLYLNLHSLYKKKVILNYKEKFHILKYETGLSITLLKKYIKILLEENIVFSPDGKHLHMGSAHKFMRYIGIAFNYLGELLPNGEYAPDFNYYHTKFVTVKRRKTLSIYELQSLSLELLQKRKRRGFLLKRHGGCRELKRNFKKVGLSQMKSNLETQCATNKTAERYLHLCLTEIQKHFALKTKQGASKRMSLLESKGLVRFSQIYKNIRKLSPENLVIPESKRFRFIKDGWLIEQLPNSTKFLKPLSEKIWWDTTITDYFEQVEKTKAEKRKGKKLGLDFSKPLVKYLNQPLVYGKKVFKETFINRLTGEVEHTAIYYVFRDLTASGRNFFTYYITNFKKLNLKSYMKIKEEVFDFALGKLA